MADHIQIGDVAPRIQYTGDGSQTVFTYPFPVFAAADMEVYLDQAQQSIGFTVNGAGQSAGGDVTFDTAPASGVLVTLRRRLAIQRTSDFQESGEFRAKVINDELDYLTAALQQISDDGVRALRLEATDPTGSLTLPHKATRANMHLGFDANGDPIATDATGPQGPPGPAGNMDGSNNLSELTDAAAARTNLGLGTAAMETVASGGSGALLRADGDGSLLTGLSITDNTARANTALNAFRIAVNGGLSIQNMVDGFVDEFEDETGVDTAGSTNETYDAAGDFYSNPGTGATSYANTGGSGNRAGVVTGSTDLTLTAGSIADMLNGTKGSAEGANFGSAEAVSGKEIKFDFGAAASKVIDEATWFENAAATSDIGTWKWQGSNDDAAWTDIGTSFVVGGTGGDQVQTQLSGNTTGYRYYRLSGVSGNTTSTHWHEEIEFKIADFVSPPDMTLLPNAVTAVAQPDEAFIAVWQEDIDAATLNTDIKAWASRDGGTTWTQITLAEKATISPGRILTGTTDISGQPAGTSMKYKVETFNAKNQKVHGVSLQWS